MPKEIIVIIFHHARVVPSVVVPRAEHVVGDLLVVVLEVGAAVPVAQDGDVDVLEGVGLFPTHPESTPPGNGGLFTRVVEI